MTETQKKIEEAFEIIHNNTEESLKLFDEILESEPDNINAINGKASSLMKLKQKDKAEEYYNKSLSIEKNSSALINLGIIHKNNGEYEKALNYFDEAIILKKELSDIVTVFKKEIFDKLDVDDLNLKLDNFNDKANKLIIEGVKNEKLGNYWDALDLYENAIEEDPSSEDAVNSMINRLNVHFQDELIYEDEKSENTSNDAVKRKVTEIILIEKRPKKASKIVEKALNKNPNDFALLNFKGGIEFSFENYEESIRYFDECIKLNPDYHYAIFNKSIVLRRLKRYEEVLECLDNLLEKPEAYNLIEYRNPTYLKSYRNLHNQK